MELADRLAMIAQRHNIPGVALAYSVDGEVVEAAAGVVNRDTGVAATSDSLFQIGSVTKLWTATLAHQLIDEGKLDLDTPIRTYLPDLKLAEELTAVALTARDLLRHTAGFEGDIFDDFGKGDDALARLVDALVDADIVSPRGELYSYCNAGYCLLGHLVATLRGTSWEQAMREHLINPLDLQHIAVSAEEAILFRAAVGHSAAPGTTEQVVKKAWQLPRSISPAGAATCASPRVLLEFAHVFLEGGRDGVLSSEAVRRSWEPQVPVPGGGGLRPDQWALGWAVYDWNGARVFGHDGDTLGQAAFLRVVPEAGFAIAAMVNGGNPQGLFTELVLPLVREITGVTAPSSPVPPASPVPVDVMPYIGKYAGTHLNYLIEPDDDGLAVTMVPTERGRDLGARQSSRVPYVLLAGDTFIRLEALRGNHPTLTFLVADGRATHLHSLGRARRRIR